MVERRSRQASQDRGLPPDVEDVIARAELLACVHPDTLIVERRVDVVEVWDRSGVVARIASSLVIVRRDGSRRGVVLEVPPALARRMSWPATVIGPPTSPGAPRMLVLAPAETSLVADGAPWGPTIRDAQRDARSA